MNPLLDKFDKEIEEMARTLWRHREYENEIEAEEALKSIAHSHLEEAYRKRLEDGAEPKKICITCLEKTGEIVPSHSDQSNLERLIEKCGDKLMSIHRTVPPKNMGDYWCAEAYFEMEKDEETPLSGRIGLGSTPTEAVENLIKALEKK